LEGGKEKEREKAEMSLRDDWKLNGGGGSYSKTVGGGAKVAGFKRGGERKGCGAKTQSMSATD